MDREQGSDGHGVDGPESAEWPADEPTAPLTTPSAPARLPGIEPEGTDRPSLHVRLFGSHQFFRLWIAQVVSATGDWLGFLAITVLAARVGSRPEAAIGLVMSARIIPGFFLAPVAGVLVDRWDRKKVMVVCDLSRAGVIALLPFVNNVAGLVAASLVLEVFTLLWAPAKEASVPNVVPADHLTSANSLSLAAAYGTFPLASLLFALLAGVGKSLSDISALDFFGFQNEETLAFYFDTLTFVVSALLISTLALPKRDTASKSSGKRRIDFTETFTEFKEGWQFIFINPTVRAVNLGLALALVGGGMLVPLGPVFVTEVLGGGEAGFGVLITALGFGVAAGVLALSALQKRLPKERVFVTAEIVGGACLVAGASMSTLGLAAAFVFGLGICAGSVYILGFTILHENVDDELRGRVFGALYTLVRLCVLVAFAAGPFLAAFLSGISESLFDDQIDLGGFTVAVPGVRLTLWLAGIIIIIAGSISAHSVRAADRLAATETEPS